MQVLKLGHSRFGKQNFLKHGIFFIEHSIYIAHILTCMCRSAVIKIDTCHELEDVFFDLIKHNIHQEKKLTVRDLNMNFEEFKN